MVVRGERRTFVTGEIQHRDRMLAALVFIGDVGWLSPSLNSCQIVQGVVSRPDSLKRGTPFSIRM
jgi:hypothetical protein